MNGLGWLAENGFTLVNALGVVGGLLFTGYSLHSETKTRKIANLLSLTQSHRDIWKEVLHQPELHRVVSVDAQPHLSPVTLKEEIFVNLVIQHLGSVFRAMRYDLTIDPKGLRRDVGEFFSLPIPRAVWNQVKGRQDDDFFVFVESCRNWRG